MQIPLRPERMTLFGLRSLLYHEGVSGGTYANGVPGGWSIWVLPLFGDHKAYPFIQSTFSAREANFSPDGKWLAYCSNESGEYRVYVVPFSGRAENGRFPLATGAVRSGAATAKKSSIFPRTIN